MERARALPVDVRERHRVTGLLREGDRVVGVQAEDEDGARIDVGARLVVGADGRASAVARALGLLRPHRLQRRGADPVRERRRGARSTGARSTSIRPTTPS